MAYKLSLIGSDVDDALLKVHNGELMAVADHTKSAHDLLGIDADTLDGQHASAFAAASHNHSLSDLTDHTKAAHDALGIDAASLQGKVATDFTQVITSNVTYQVYGSGADFATLTEAFDFLKDKWIPNDVTVILSIPSGVFDITAETPIVPVHPCLDRIIVAGAGAESSVLQCFGDNAAFFISIPTTFNIQHLKLQGAGSALSNAVAFNLMHGGVINANSVRISGMFAAFIALFGSRVVTTDCLCILDVSWGYRFCYGSVGSIGFTTNPPAQSINDSWIYAAIGSSICIQSGKSIQLTGAVYGVRSAGAHIEAPAVSVSGASIYDFAAGYAGLIVNNAGSGSTNFAVNVLSADGSIIIR
jgi:hypothetical protein